MKNKKWCFISIVELVCIVVLGTLIYVNSFNTLNVDCVQSADDAIEIGKTICETVYREFDYSKYQWECIYDEQECLWRVFCVNDDSILGGGTPEIHIKKKNAEVVYIGLAL